MRKWLGQEALAEKIREGKGPIFIITREAGREVTVIRQILEDIASERPGCGQDVYCVPDWTDPSRYRAIVHPSGCGRTWQEKVEELPEELLRRYWSAKTEEMTAQEAETLREDLAAEALEPLVREWPHTVEYLTGLIERIVDTLEDTDLMDLIEWLPELLWQGGHCPVVRAGGLSRSQMIGREDRRGERRWVPGLLHRAAGGYLLVDGVELVGTGGWPCLRDALLQKEIVWPCKVVYQVQPVIYGSAGLYRVLCEVDPEFELLFSHTIYMPATLADSLQWRAVWGEMISEELEMPLTDETIDVTLRYLWREGEWGRIPCHADRALPLLRQAGEKCCLDGADVLSAEHVRDTIREMRIEKQRMAVEYFEENKVLTDHLSLTGREIARVYGLAVLDLGYMRLGEPIPIVATFEPEISVESAEQTRRLGGRIFEKSWDTLRGYFGGKKKGRILVNFERNYDPIEGDSALLAQAYSILSRRNDVPVRQNVAVTGTLDSRGCVLAVGGIHEKIEGFYDFCRWRGIQGAGVIFPAENQTELHLSEDVLQAVESGEFYLYPIRTLEEGIPVLMEISAKRMKW